MHKGKYTQITKPLIGLFQFPHFSTMDKNEYKLVGDCIPLPKLEVRISSAWGSTTIQLIHKENKKIFMNFSGTNCYEPVDTLKQAMELLLTPKEDLG